MDQSIVVFPLAGEMELISFAELTGEDYVIKPGYLFDRITQSWFSSLSATATKDKTHLRILTSEVPKNLLVKLSLLDG